MKYSANYSIPKPEINDNYDITVIAQIVDGVDAAAKLTEDTKNSVITEEQARKDTELIRISNETTRISNENTRQTNETAREQLKSDLQALQGSLNDSAADEAARITAENNRVSNENTRIANENNRVSVENSRITEFDSWRQTIEGAHLGDMSKATYDKNNNGKVDVAEVAESVEWTTGVQNKPTNIETTEGAQAKANAAETNAKGYTDAQIQTVTATGIPKLVTYEYDLYATVEGQTVFTIPYDYYSHDTDTLIVETGTNMPKSYYTITDPVTNPDNSITKGFITLSEGRPNGSFLKMRILKNVPIGPDGAIQGTVMAIDSIPQNRVQGLVDLDNTINTHLADYSTDIGISNAYKINLTPSPTSYEIGKIYKFKAKNTNTGVSTFQIDSLSSIPIKKNVSSDLVSGDIIAGQIILLVYDGTNMQVIGVPGITSAEKANFNNHLSALVTDTSGVHGMKVETGTFTPVLTDASNNQVTSYGIQAGYYHRIGNRVFYEIYISIGTKGTSLTGTIFLTGLPFAPKTGNGMYYCASVCEFDKISRGTQMIGIYLAPTESRLYFRLGGDNTDSTLLSATQITNGSAVMLSGNYLIN